MTPSDEGTPQTDAASKQWPEADARDGRFIFSGVSVELVSADFARQLERALQAAKRENGELRVAAMKADPCWYERVATQNAEISALNTKLQAANERAARLEEALREIAEGKTLDDALHQAHDEIRRLRARLQEATAQLQAARSDLEGFKNMLQAVTTDRNPNGKTLVDFFNCWLDQERDASAVLRAELQAANERAARLEEALVAARKSHNKEIRDLEREARDAARDAAAEERWKHQQGDEYGSY